MILYDRRKKEQPLIRMYGNACERTKRQALQLMALAALSVTIMFLLLQGSTVTESLDAEVKHVRDSIAAHVKSRAPQQEALSTAPVRAIHTSAADIDGASGPDDCSVERREIISGIASGILSPPLATFPAADLTKQHLDALMQLLKPESPKLECWRRQRRVLQEPRAGAVASWFFDLGSRAMDQTTVFLKTFPSASSFRIACFEANPKFNSLYRQFAEKNPSVQLSYFNEAVGVENTTLVLSNANVGSSIVREGIRGGRSNSLGASTLSAGDALVRVTDFSASFANLVLGPELQLESNSHVVVKMDIEKMEFSVLHRMLLTNVFVLVDELLLECHYNTNLPPEKRDPSKHIGLDDCVNLVAHLNAAFSGLGFEAVLWNSKKTAKASGYSARHGGFYPS